MYLTVKYIHVSAVVLSLSFFTLRGLWMLTDSPRLKERWAFRLPQAIDSVLLISAIGLTQILHQYPFVHDWLTAKVVALLAYIVLGTIALKRGRSKRIRSVALVAALLTAGYIVSVALSHHPFPWRTWN